MNSLEINRHNHHMNYLNNISTKNIVAIKRNPLRYIDQDNFGERVQEKNNYLLYVSGNQKSYYELNPQETQFKSKEKHNPKLYNNKSFISSYKTKIQKNYIIPKNPFQDNILDISENYGFKETRNIKDTKNKNVTTLNDTQTTKPKKEMVNLNNLNNLNKKSKINKIKKNENKIPLKKNSERNYRLKEIKVNKSTDNILRRKTNYKIKINNETMPNNHKSKAIRVTKDKNGNLKEIYQRKYVPKNEYINNIQHLYINNNNYGEKSHEPSYFFKNNNFNCNFYNIYNYESKSANNNGNINNKNKNGYFINNNYECNGYDLNNNYGFYKQEIFVDDESKNIECPIHKNISIVVHKNRHNNNNKNQIYKNYK